MNPNQEVQKALGMCQDSAAKLRSLAQTESSMTCRELLMDAAHHLDVAAAEVSYAASNT